MSTTRHGIATVDQLDDYRLFDDIIDVRTPAEFAEDHIPGSINCPVLDNEQRIEVGTLYKQHSPFAAKKIGAAYVAENIARHLRTSFQDRPQKWRPLIVCWRGGQRSGAMTLILRRVGWDAQQLQGGYKTYRTQVLAELAELPRRMAYTVVCGATGSGKSRVLQALAQRGEQVLDLEELACHKGSVLGVLPDSPQPSQKMFESRLLVALRGFDPQRAVFVEAESRKIGCLQVPDALLETMRTGHCITIDATLAARVAFPVARLRILPASTGLVQLAAGRAAQPAQPRNHRALAGAGQQRRMAGAGPRAARPALRRPVQALADTPFHRPRCAADLCDR